MANTMVSKASLGEVTCYLGNSNNITSVDDLMNSVTCEDVTTSEYTYIYIGGDLIFINSVI